MANNKLLLVVGLALLASIGTYFFPKLNNTPSVNAKNNIISYLTSDILDASHDLHLRIEEFSDWTITHNKQYATSELATRFGAWNSNYAYVQEHNSKNLSWTLEMNKFADLTSEEFSSLYLGFNYDQAQKEERNEDHSLLQEGLEAPTTLDWRTKGAVSSIKNQGSCGACWAFAVCSSMESLYYLKKKSLPDLSEQQLVDCSSRYGNQACNGGTMVAAFQYTRDYGVETESVYPYRTRQGSCGYQKSKVFFKNSGYASVPQRNPTALLNAVAAQPVTVGVEASGRAFQLYKSGVITSNCGTSLDHAITAVGYDKSSWIVKNSWGTGWGERGYVRIARGSQNGGSGLCGINLMASYPKF